MSQQKRIGPGGAFLLVALGLFIDAIQIFADFILIGFIIDPVISIMATIIYTVWLSHYNIWMLSGKRGWAGWASLFTEILPGIDALPAWTMFSTYTVIKNRTDTSTV